METTGNLPNAQYRRFEGMREYEEVIDRMIGIFQEALALVREDGLF